MEYVDYEKLHKDTIAKLQEMVNSGKITVETARGICADFVPESEDEKIRNVLVDYFKRYKEQEECGIKTFYGIPTDNIIAWLEKQGEHANFRNKIQIGDKVTRNKDGVLVNLSQLKRVAKPVNEEQEDILEDVILDSNEDGLIAETIHCKKEKQGEQKPTQEIEPFEAEHGKYYYCIKDYYCGGKKQASKGDVIQALRGLPIMGLKDASEYFLPVNFIKCNSAWSEEDEDKIKEIKNALYKQYGEDKAEDLYYYFLEPILYKVQPQLKQEWSKEDESLRLRTIGALVTCKIGSPTKCVDEQINWLKSLKPQSRWKPSEEQMDALHYVTNFDYGGHKSTLVSLYEQLKKLRKE